MAVGAVLLPRNTNSVTRWPFHRSMRTKTKQWCLTAACMQHSISLKVFLFIMKSMLIINQAIVIGLIQATVSGDMKIPLLHLSAAVATTTGGDYKTVCSIIQLLRNITLLLCWDMRLLHPEMKVFQEAASVL